jgi:hypothetical protein
VGRQQERYVKLWHDDVRPPPSGWEWARTNESAKGYLRSGYITEISLDHDLGYDGPPPGECENCDGSGAVGDLAHGEDCPECDGDGFIGGDVLYIAGTADETGYDLVRWMCETGNVPAKVTVHSWNPDGAKRMAALLRDHGHACDVVPYTLQRFSR